MADILGNLRFKYNKTKNGLVQNANSTDLIMDYEDRIHEFFKSFSDTYDGVLYFDAISKRVRELDNLENEERIKKHVKAEEMLSKSQFGIVNK